MLLVRILFKVQSSPPKTYNISPNVGVVHNNQTTLIKTMGLVSSDMGLVQFLSTVPGNYFLMDQIVVLVAEVHGNTAATFSSLPVVDNAEAITEYFLVNSVYARKELSMQYNFSNELRGILSLVLSPPAHSHVPSPPTDDASIMCATALESLFPAESGTVSQPETTVFQLETDTCCDPSTECTQQSEQVSNVRQSNCARATAKHNFGHDTCSALKLPAPLEVLNGWTITGTALLDKSEFSTKSALLDNFLSNRINAYVASTSIMVKTKEYRLGR
jgi:hypothetical protein